MTRKEAIQKLMFIGEEVVSESQAEAIEMAIEALSAEPNCKDCKKRNNTTFFMDDEETIDTAIEAPQEPSKVDYRTDESANIGTEVNNLISRADAIEEISKGVWNVHELVDRINALPSADRPIKVIAEIKVDTEEVVKRIKEEYEIADRSQGEWIFNPKDAIELMFTKPKCSECGFESSDGGNYCPNCGAEMKKEE